MIFSKHLRSRESARRMRRRVYIWGAGGCVAVLGLAVLAAWASFRPEVTLSRITVHGTETLKEDTIRSHVSSFLSGRYLGVFNKANVFLAPLAAAEAALAKNFPRLAEASVTRTALTDVAVSVSERKPFGLWCADTHTMGGLAHASTTQPEQLRRCYFFDNKGVIFTRAPYFTGTVYFTMFGEFKGTPVAGLSGHTPPLGERVLPEAVFNRIVTIRKQLEEAGFSPHALHLGAANDYAFLFPNGVRVRFNGGQPPGAVLHNLGAALDTESLSKDDFTRTDARVEYVDLRFGNKVYVK